MGTIRNIDHPAAKERKSFAEVLAERAERVAGLRSQVAEWSREKPWTLEIGCGHGHWLVAYATAHPDKYCIGLDMLSARVAKANAKKERLGLNNLVFVKAEANEFLEAMPENVHLDEVVILFPDPWPKKRHFKNRLIQIDFLDILAKFMLPHSKIYFRTDDRGYFDWAKDIFLHHEKWEVLSSEPWLFEYATYFQNLNPEYQSLIADRKG